jgi:hypothetical protein
MGLHGIVYAVAVSEATGDVYAGGVFNQAGGVPGTKRLARWDGTRWHDVGGGVAEGKWWDGTRWNDVGSGVGEGKWWWVNAIAVSGTDVYVGGTFGRVGGVKTGCIAKWDGREWSGLGSGLGEFDPKVRALAVKGSDVYVGGIFSHAGGVEARNIARWDGREWHALGSGKRGSGGKSGGTRAAWVEDIAVKGSDVYVGGGFIDAGGRTTRYIGRWDGETWHEMDEDDRNPVVGSVAALTVWGEDVYAGGHWTHNQMPMNCLAKWDGRAWDDLGEVTSDTVCAIGASRDYLYIGGWFNAPGRYIARWDGREWSSMGSGTNHRVYAIAMNEATGEVYAGGAFTEVG